MAVTFSLDRRRNAKWMLILYTEMAIKGLAGRPDRRCSELLDALVRRGSRDPDVLYLERRRLLTTARAQLGRGCRRICLGGLLTLTLIGAVVGVPICLRGWRRIRLARHELRAIDASFAAFEGLLSQRVEVECRSARRR